MMVMNIFVMMIIIHLAKNHSLKNWSFLVQ